MYQAYSAKKGGFGQQNTHRNQINVRESVITQEVEHSSGSWNHQDTFELAIQVVSSAAVPESQNPRTSISVAKRPQAPTVIFRDQILEMLFMFYSCCFPGAIDASIQEP